MIVSKVSKDIELMITVQEWSRDGHVMIVIVETKDKWVLKATKVTSNPKWIVLNCFEWFWMQLNWILFDFVEFFKILEFLKGVKMGILVLNFGLKGWKSLKWLKLLQNGIISEVLVMHSLEWSWMFLNKIDRFVWMKDFDWPMAIRKRKSKRNWKLAE